MSYRLIIKPDAELDILSAVLWYDLQKTGLGDDFLLSLDAEFSSLCRNPLLYQVQYRNVRRCFMSRFPYGIYYMIEKEIIYILAAVHSKRDEKIWKSRFVRTKKYLRRK